MISYAVSLPDKDCEYIYAILTLVGDILQNNDIHSCIKNKFKEATFQVVKEKYASDTEIVALIDDKILSSFQ